MHRQLLPSIFFAFALAGCASTGSKLYLAGHTSERSGRYDEAVTFYTRALDGDRDNLHYRQALARARLRSSESHALEATRRIHAGDLHGAKEELEVAITMNPHDGALVDRLAELRSTLEQQGEKARLRTIDALKQQLRERPFGGLAISPEAVQPAGFVFRDASLRDVFLSLGKMAGVNVIFDSDFRDQTLSIELEDATFEEVFQSLSRITQNFYRAEGQKVVIVIPDTQAKRNEYAQQVARTFYLSSADVKETIDLLRIVLGARRIAPHTSTNALTIVDTPERVQAAETIITTLDKNKGEVVVDVELLEVNRARMEEYGIQLTSANPGGGDGIDTAVFPGNTTLDNAPYTASNLFAANLPGAVLKLLRVDGDTRVLANPQLRALDGQPAEAEFGERVPVPVTTFQPIATGGVPQQPITSFQYQNIGVTIIVTPRVHHNDEISLALEVRLDNISGTGFGGLPTFGNRRVNTVLRLKDGETSLLAGLIRDDERTQLTGTPGLARVPVLGRIFGANQTEVRESDIILTLTPRIVRRADLSIEDLRPHLIEGVRGGSLVYEPPTPLPRRDPESERNPEDTTRRPRRRPQQEPQKN